MAYRAPCIVQDMPVRMKDIAKDLGLSVVTISKVLRDHPDISEETRARVLKHVKDRDYQPNILARSLVTGHSYLIGLIVPDLIHPFFAEIAKALSRGDSTSWILTYHFRPRMKMLALNRRSSDSYWRDS